QGTYLAHVEILGRGGLRATVPPMGSAYRVDIRSDRSICRGCPSWACHCTSTLLGYAYVAVEMGQALRRTARRAQEVELGRLRSAVRNDGQGALGRCEAEQPINATSDGPTRESYYARGASAETPPYFQPDVFERRMDAFMEHTGKSKPGSTAKPRGVPPRKGR